MKSMMIVAVLGLSANAFASGSTDYICAAQKSNIRFTYNEGESQSANLFRATGVNQTKANTVVVKENSLTLDAFQVVEILARGNEVVLDGCSKDDTEYKTCIAKKTGADFEAKSKVDTFGNNFKGQRITLTGERKDGTTVKLDIHNYEEKTYDGEFSGTLEVTTKDASYKNIGVLKVTCQVSTP